MSWKTRIITSHIFAIHRHFSSRAFKPVDIPPEQNEVERIVPQCEQRKLGARVACTSGRETRKAWIETLKFSGQSTPVGITDLHPNIFAAFPRLDLVHKNLYWQAHYRMVDWRSITTRSELPYRSNRKPWPQKGTGRARHGNRRTHIWIGGGQCKGPRGPESYFSILPRDVRIAGLLSMLSIKHAQDDLHIVDNLQLSQDVEQEALEVIKLAIETQLEESAEDDPLSAVNRIRSHRLTKAMNDSASYLRALMDDRKWGPSVLFVTSDAVMPFLDGSLEQTLSHLLDSSKNLDGLAIYLACSSYANHIDAELSPEAIGYPVEAVAPRATHPGRGLTLMPLHGLNVWSLVHHETVVFSQRCLEQLEHRLLAAMRMIVRDKAVENPVISSLITPYHGEYEDDAEETEPTTHRHFPDPPISLHWKKINLS